MNPRPALVAAFAIAIASAPSPASAHGIGGDGDGDGSIPSYVTLGFEHMLLGWDHLLFIAGVLLVAQEWRRAAKLITAFVAGHSTTLIAATLAGWQVNAFAVDLVIAFSVVVVGILAVTQRQVDWSIFGAVVFAFGLAHGLGLSTRLQALDPSEDGLLWRVIAFNVGVESGQLTAILAFLALGALTSLVVGVAREPLLRKVAMGGVLLGGVAALGVGAYIGPADEPTRQEEIAAGVEATDTGSDCAIEDRTEQFPSMGGHVATNFYEPEQVAPLADFGHSVGDGYVAVLYPPDITEGDLDELRAWVNGPDGKGLLAGPTSDVPDTYKVVNAYFTMVCSKVDMDATKEFAATWFDSIS